MGLPILFARKKKFNPLSLFAAGEQGVWYDPSDWTTLFQDSAGTTPITAIEQPVGLMLDKSKGLVLGPELVTNGTFDTDSGWTKGTGWTISGGKATKSAGTVSNLISTSAVVSARKLHICTFVISDYSAGALTFYAGLTGTGVSTPALTANGTYKYYLFGGSSDQKIYVQGNSTFVGSIDNISVREISGNHASQPTTASRPILRQEAGGQYYLAFDGSDDWLSTANIDFSATDKVSVFAGVRKLSDSQQRIIAELSATIASNNGAFMLSAPNSAAANYNFSSKGTSQVDNTVTTYAAPITNVVTGLADISGPNNTIRINGAATPLTTSQGTGNYGSAYPLYIGRRFNTAETSFSGRLYSLLIRGALTSSPQLEQTENWVAGKTGVTL